MDKEIERFYIRSHNEYRYKGIMLYEFNDHLDFDEEIRRRYMNVNNGIVLKTITIKSYKINIYIIKSTQYNLKFFINYNIKSTELPTSVIVGFKRLFQSWFNSRFDNIASLGITLDIIELNQERHTLSRRDNPIIKFRLTIENLSFETIEDSEYIDYIAHQFFNYLEENIFPFIEKPEMIDQL